MFRITSLALSSFMASLLGALTADNPAHATQYKNIVVGEGCASICVDGVCERTCKNSASAGDLNASADKASAAVSRKHYDASEFSTLVINDVDVEVVAADEFAVAATGEAACLANLEVKVGRGLGGATSLRVSLGKACSGHSDIQSLTKVSISMPKLESLRLYGNSEAQVLGFDQKELNIETYSNTGLVLDQSSIEKVLLVAEGNSTVNLAKSYIFNADVAMTGQSDVTLRLGKEVETGYLTGMVAGMSDLLYCGATAKSLKISGLADANQIDCDQIGHN